MSYSLRDVVDDGILRAPRWLQHAFKLMLHTSLTGLGLAVFGLAHPVLMAVIGGPVVYVGIKAWAHLFPRPSAFALTRSHFGDIGTDGALATIPVAGAFLAVRDLWQGAGLLTLCALSYAVCHREARP